MKRINFIAAAAFALCAWVIYAADLPQSIEGSQRIKIEDYISSSQLNISQFNSGTAADATTYWRGDKTWAAVAGGVTLAGYETVISPSDIMGWMTGYGSTTTNAAAPVYWSTTDATSDCPCIGFTSSDTVGLQSRYAFAVLKVPSYASGWKSGSNLVINIKTSSPSTVTNLINFRIASPSGTVFSSNSLVSSTANTLKSITIPLSDIPAFEHPTSLTNWTVRFDFQCFAGSTCAVESVKIPFQ